MRAYLLDTTILSIFLDDEHPQHAEKSEALDEVLTDSAQFVSVVALAELEFGMNLAINRGKAAPDTLRAILAKAQRYAVLDVTRHTAESYADVKARIACKFLRKTARKDRPKYVADWVDQATDKALGIGENDLWMCAQAKERGLVFVTADKRMKRIQEADPEVRLLVI